MRDQDRHFLTTKNVSVAKKSIPSVVSLSLIDTARSRVNQAIISSLSSWDTFFVTNVASVNGNPEHATKEGFPPTFELGQGKDLIFFFK